ncbi:hypothetical protein FOL47_001654 [Perkinsus chesapeaki]|uniref:Peptidase A1 domain-containing protein n=1 Tax=Perkinsus chesapeaki TaxID=330153 RepID=A0A7J6MI08_PERCH|nr:hypothetical protein FOL47_001654 [Perkinsus chesapeaki]
MRSSCIVLTLSAKASIAEVITLPITEGYIPLTLDGQKTNVIMDTGTARSFVIHGPSYEKKNGEGSCSRLLSGCYFCPIENPCNDILERKRWTVPYETGGVYEYVEHSLTLTIGSIIIKHFTIGLAINHSDNNCTPQGFLGLSFGRRYLPETALEQLKRRGIISNLQYSIDINGPNHTMSGVLSIGNAQLVDSHPLRMDHGRRYAYHRKTSIPVPMVTIVDSDDKSYADRGDNIRRYGDMELVVVDSGATVIDVPLPIFDQIDQVMVEMANRTDAVPVPRTGKKLMVKDPKSGFMLVRKEHVKYLPTIVYCIGAWAGCIDLSIEPKHYLRDCDDVQCKLAIGPVPDGKCPLLGWPLFKAYRIGFDLSKKLLYFPKSAVRPCQHRFNFQSYFSEEGRLRRWSEACVNALNIYLRLPL